MKLIEIKNLFEQVKAFSGDNEDIDAELQYIIENIKRDCQPFIKAGMPKLWRGLEIEDPMIRRLSPYFYIGSVRNKRKPTHTALEIQKIINDFFKKKVGIPVRSASLFVTGDMDEASAYGDPFIIIPIGEYHFTWSPVITDFYADFSTAFEGESGRPNVDAKINKKLLSLIKSAYKDLGFDPNTNIDNQMMLNAFEYILDNHGDELYKFDDDLNQAVKSGHEIMLVCDKYYLFEPNGEIDTYKLINALK